MNCDVDKVFNKTGVKVVTEKFKTQKQLLEEWKKSIQSYLVETQELIEILKETLNEL